MAGGLLHIFELGAIFERRGDEVHRVPFVPLIRAAMAAGPKAEAMVIRHGGRCGEHLSPLATKLGGGFDPIPSRGKKARFGAARCRRLAEQAIWNLAVVPLIGLPWRLTARPRSGALTWPAECNCNCMDSARNALARTIGRQLA
jgi:hypothetical protein